MKIDISRVYDDCEAVFLGKVELADNIHLPEYENPGKFVEAEWDEWTEECPFPDSDSDFIVWLCEKFSGKPVESNHQAYVG